jgi:cytochrome c oxidase subunit 4
MAATHEEHVQVSGEHQHPGDAQYIGIAAALAVVTAIEVALYYLKHDTATTVALLILMVVKFAVVVGFFMHLRFDSPLLRRLFVGGLMLAVSIYVITLFMFGAFYV